MVSFFDSTEQVCRIDTVFLSRGEVGRYVARNRTHCELVYKCAGSSTQIFPDITLRLEPDCLYFIPASSRNNQYIIDQSGDTYVVFFDLYGPLAETGFQPEIFQLPPNNPIKAQFERLLSIWRKPKHTRSLDAQTAFLAILSQVAQMRRQVYISSTQYRLIQPAIDLIEQDCAQPIDIPKLTALCGISDEYLRQLFHACTGTTPMGYLRQLRMRCARELLLSGQYSVGEAARACGYKDSRYFSRLYRAQYGVPPGKS